MDQRKRKGNACTRERGKGRYVGGRKKMVAAKIRERRG
jgi:hypothetical protein